MAKVEGQVSALIIDDEKPARDELAYLLKGIPEVNVIGQARNGLEAFNLIKQTSPDLIFLDVQMPGLDGFGLIKKLMGKKVRLPHIVFATAYDEYAVRAFEVNAVDYLLKPFDKARVSKSVARARKSLESNQGRTERIEALLNRLEPAQALSPVKLLLKNQQRLSIIDSDELVYATIEDGIITIFSRDSEGTSNYRTLEELQAALNPERFWRVHRSYLVNINHIKEVVPWFKSSYLLRMKDRRVSEIQVSRAQTRRLRELFKL